MNSGKKPQTVEEYIEQSPAQTKRLAKELRKLILEAAPNASEKLSYGMPYYDYHGRLIYFSVREDYVGLYVMSARDVLQDEIKPYRTSKATLHFFAQDPLPTALIKKIIKTQVSLNERKNLDTKRDSL